MTAPATIDSFRGAYAFLSNFAWVGDTTVEHQWQAEKTLNPDVRARILQAKSPGAAKLAGRQVQLRADWEEIKYERMKFWLDWKFSQPVFAAQLEATGNAVLIEGNQWGDEIWGRVWRHGHWEGQNWLGKLLMQIRAERREKALVERAEL